MIKQVIIIIIIIIIITAKKRKHELTNPSPVSTDTRYTFRKHHKYESSES